MYLYRFSMTKIPFGQTPDTSLFYRSPTHIEALNVLQFAVATGESFCKICGEVGTGKTMLCRILMRKLENERKLAYIPTPHLNSNSLYYILSKELGLRLKSETDEQKLLTSIQKRLIKLNKKFGPVVLIIDEAQSIPEETLEALRLLTNIETENQKLLQIVLFGQPELDKILNQNKFRQLKQRISFSYHLDRLGYSQVKYYIRQRLTSVSIGSAIKISPLTYALIAYFSGGIPRVINILCHKALLLSYAKNIKRITANHVIKSAVDTECVNSLIVFRLKLISAIFLLGVSTTTLAYWGGA
jgi:MSHA biogenesis protein MshM